MWTPPELTYNHQNWVGTGCKERTDAGLTTFGLELVEKMNDVGMLIDLSHANAATMADAIRASKVPVTISHTGCMSVYENVRNSTDESMKLLADRGGVVGICQIRPFLIRGREGARRNRTGILAPVGRGCPPEFQRPLTDPPT